MTIINDIIICNSWNAYILAENNINNLPFNLYCEGKNPMSIRFIFIFMILRTFLIFYPQKKNYSDFHIIEIHSFPWNVRRVSLFQESGLQMNFQKTLRERTKGQKRLFLDRIYILNINLIVYIIILMEHQAKVSNKPLHYAKIALKTRKELAHLVEDRQWSISKASKKLGIRPSTGKLIMKKYREEGIFFQKKQDKQARLATNTQDTISQVQQDQKPQQNVPNVLNYGTLPLDYTGMANNIYLLSGSMNILQNKFWGIADWSFIGSGLPQHVPWGFYS